MNGCERRDGCEHDTRRRRRRRRGAFVILTPCHLLTRCHLSSGTCGKEKWQNCNCPQSQGELIFESLRNENIVPCIAEMIYRVLTAIIV